MVGRTQEGYRYQPVRFVDHMKVMCRTVCVVAGPPEIHTPQRAVVNRRERGIRAYATTPENIREIHRLKTEGFTQWKVAELTGWSKRTIERLWNRAPARSPSDKSPTSSQVASDSPRQVATKSPTGGGGFS